jgi:hypothetical protein
MATAFVKQENVQMLWELLLDSLPNNKININNLQNVFLSNVKQFGEVEKHNITPANLVSANKHFLKNMVALISRQNQDNNNNNNNLTYLAKDIQAQRQNQFDIQMAQRQQEFDSLLTIKKPPVPNFADDIDLANEKLSADNIRQMISQTVSQRNYDTSNINSNNNNNTNIFDKINANTKQVFKQIKIDSQELPKNDFTDNVIDLDNGKKKQVSWSESLVNDNNNIVLTVLEKEERQEREERQEKEERQERQEEKPFNILDRLKVKKVDITNNISEEQFVSLNNKIDELTNKINLILEILQTQANNKDNNTDVIN